MIDNDRENMENFIQDVEEVLKFFNPIKEEIQKAIEKYLNYKPGCSWNEENLEYDIRILSIGGTITSIDAIIFNLLNEHIKLNKNEWIQQFSHKAWFKYSEDYVYVSKEMCNFIARIILTIEVGEDFDETIERELDILFEMKSPIIKRSKQVIIQNLIVTEDQIIKFNNQVLLIKGREERWHENGIPKSCTIEDFTLNFQIQLRRLTSQEFEILTHRKGLLASQMNISTCLEIIYEFPNDRFSNFISELRLKMFLALTKVEEFIEKIINNIILSLKLSTGQYVFPVSSPSKPENYYLKELFSESIPIVNKNYMYSFFTGKCVLTSDRSHVVQEIFNHLFDAEKYPILKQVLIIIEHADNALQYDLALTSLTMYWIIMETIFSGLKKYIAHQISWIYQSKEIHQEREFWDLVYDLRNSYMHGGLWDEIDKKIKDKYKNKNISWFVLVTREKTMRILLYLLLLRESLDYSDSIFQTKIKFNKSSRLTPKDWIMFRRWIQMGNENELGKLEKYQIKMGLRMVSI